MIEKPIVVTETPNAAYKVGGCTKDNECYVRKEPTLAGCSATYYFPWSDLRQVANAMLRAADAKEGEERLAKRVPELRERFGRWAEKFAWLETQGFRLEGYASMIRGTKWELYKAHVNMEDNCVFMVTRKGEAESDWCSVTARATDVDGFEDALRKVEECSDFLGRVLNVVNLPNKEAEPCKTSNERPS